MIKAGIIGATGYVGSELVRLLSAHPEAEIIKITSQTYAGKNYGEVFENFSHAENFVCADENIGELAGLCDVVFIALPHGVASRTVTRGIVDKAVIIDLGADFRLNDADVYEKWYETKHYSADLLGKAVYGLCEINRGAIKGSRLIANPGCYTTCSILSLYPLLKESVIDPETVIIDAKSGVTGAGRGGAQYCDANESVKAYKIGCHRHTPEIEEQLSLAAGKGITVAFTPHLIPMNRGILTTCYANLPKGYAYEDIMQIYRKYYGSEYFIRLTRQGVFPETKWVRGSNFTDIGFAIDDRHESFNRIIVVSALDNMLKGAAGQAVQNMNILFGIDERTGIDQIPAFPS